MQYILNADNNRKRPLSQTESVPVNHICTTGGNAIITPRKEELCREI
nr:MAG TPA: hypothetical protein [Caudoviricetes sp.]